MNPLSHERLPSGSSTAFDPFDKLSPGNPQSAIRNPQSAIRN